VFSETETVSQIFQRSPYLHARIGFVYSKVYVR